MFKKVFEALKPAVYNYKQDNDLGLTPKHTFGVMAQDVEKGLIDAGFNPEEFSILGKDQRGNHMVDYVQIIPLLISEINELKARVQELEYVSSEDSQSRFN